MESPESNEPAADIGHVGPSQVVQFHDTETFFCDAVGDFLHAGARAGSGSR